MSTYTLIQSQTLASSAASVTFSSIPATYTDLVLRTSVRTDRVTFPDRFILNFNGIVTSVYSDTLLMGSGSAATTVNNVTNTYLPNGVTIDSAAYTTNTYGSSELYIPNYTASQSKPLSWFSVSENNATAAEIFINAGLFANTAAINQMVLISSSGSNFLATSSFYLYGISNA